MRRAWLVVLVCVLASIAIAEMPPVAVSDEASLVAIQHGGRIKPLHTFARVALLQISGRTSVTPGEGGSTSPAAWLLECLYHPDAAAARPIFLVENPAVMDALGLDHTTTRARFSYREIRAKRSLVFTLAGRARQDADNTDDPARKQVLRLADSVRLFESITRAFRRLDPGGGPALSDLLQRIVDEPSFPTGLVRYVDSEPGHTLSMIPPRDPASGEQPWLEPADLASGALAGTAPAPHQVAAVRMLERIAASELDAPELPGMFREFRAMIADAAPGNRQLEQVPREVHFYRLDPFRWSACGYAAAALLLLIAIRFPNRRTWHAAGLFVCSAAFALHGYGVVLRCVIQGRPPVTTLYETLLFVSLVGVAIALLAEGLQQRRFAGLVGALVGAAGLVLAGKYELIEAADTMPSLAAVLDTNFWLSIHVTTITIGYAAGLVCSAVAHVYLLARALGRRPDDAAYYHELTRTVYGLLCLTLVFSTVGTFLGGIWANESWGRFWGWDPKENGALMIVLWGLAVLHARQGGYVDELGLHLAAIAGGILVAFSWFGVNLLGVGLHSYGFTSGIQSALYSFYAFEWCVVWLAAIVWLKFRWKQRA